MMSILLFWGMVDVIDNQILLRGEIGVSIDIGNGWSGFSDVVHIFSNNYNTTDCNLGLNYNW